MFTALKILEMLDGKELKEAVKELPTWHAFKAKMEFRKMRKEVLMEKIKDMFKNDKINDMDGIRVDYKDYWIMIRPSGTEHNMLRVWASSREKEKAELKCKELIEKIERIFSENILD
jgi:phosphomannomutase